jgi:putative ABC transport system ATP-binding protein
MLPLADRVVELVPNMAHDDHEPETIELAAGAVLFEQGTMGDLIYIVSKGAVDLVRELETGQEELLKTAQPGDYFGEMGPLFALPRSATARAAADATVIGYTVQAFRGMLGAGGSRDIIEHKSLNSS